MKKMAILFFTILLIGCEMPASKVDEMIQGVWVHTYLHDEYEYQIKINLEAGKVVYEDSLDSTLRIGTYSIYTNAELVDGKKSVLVFDFEENMMHEASIDTWYFAFSSTDSDELFLKPATISEDEGYWSFIRLVG